MTTEAGIVYLPNRWSGDTHSDKDTGCVDVEATEQLIAKQAAEIERLKSQLLEQVPAGMFIEYEEGCWEQMADNCENATPLFHRKDYK